MVYMYLNFFIKKEVNKMGVKCYFCIGIYVVSIVLKVLLLFF